MTTVVQMYLAVAAAGITLRALDYALQLWWARRASKRLTETIRKMEKEQGEKFYKAAAPARRAN